MKCKLADICSVIDLYISSISLHVRVSNRQTTAGNTNAVNNIRGSVKLKHVMTQPLSFHGLVYTSVKVQSWNSQLFVLTKWILIFVLVVHAKMTEGF
jgi:hypothetical protein